MKKSDRKGSCVNDSHEKGYRKGSCGNGSYEKRVIPHSSEEQRGKEI
ncbi:MAG TPA: hypothetical protein GXX75_26185 [Clostridiales bacterium]|nr:hypothetical protein [Clostridiales bacterium]